MFCDTFLTILLPIPDHVRTYTSLYFGHSVCNFLCGDLACDLDCNLNRDFLRGDLVCDLDRDFLCGNLVCDFDRDFLHGDLVLNCDLLIFSSSDSIGPIYVEYFIFP